MFKIFAFTQKMYTVELMGKFHFICKVDGKPKGSSVRGCGNPDLRKENHFRTCFPFSHLPITKLSCRRNIIIADKSELLKQPLMSNPECDLGGESLGHSSHPFSSHSKHSSKLSSLLRAMQR